MGKKRIIKKGNTDSGSGTNRVSGSSKHKIEHGILNIQATYNNTKISLADAQGNVLLWSSSGSLGFAGAKKGTPFAAGKIAEMIADKAQTMGLKEADVVVKGVGAGREAAIRAFVAKGVVVNSIKDMTPIPFNGPKPPKPRRV